MRTITLVIELTYDDEMIHGNDTEAQSWFDEILAGQRGELRIFSDEMGDDFGTIQVIERKVSA